MNQILAAELCAYTALLADLQHLLLPFQIAEAAPALIAGGGQRIEIAGRSLLDRRKAHLGRCSADADGQMVGRAGRRSQILDMGLDELRQGLFVEQGLRLLVEEGFVCRAAAFGNEEELILHAGMSAIDVDLRRKVRSRILLLDHRERHDLRVAEIAVPVGFIDAARDVLGIIDTRIDVLPLVADTDGRTRILAGRQFALGSHALVEQHRIGHETVVVRGFGILQDMTQFFQMRRTQIERHVTVRCLRQQFQPFGVDLQNLAAVALHDLHIIFGQQTVLRSILAYGERLLIDEFRHNRVIFRLSNVVFQSVPPALQASRNRTGGCTPASSRSMRPPAGSQRYEKSGADANGCLPLPRRSIQGEAKDTNLLRNNR